MAHYSFLPIDVGFDLRLHHFAVEVPADATSVEFLGADNEAVRAEGDTETLVARMLAAGYQAKAAASVKVEP
jgi:hypothetical protein